MAEFVADCPRCRAKRSTLDVYSSLVIASKYNWKHYLEIACVCRTCAKYSIMMVSRKSTSGFENVFGSVGTRNLLVQYRGSINDIVEFEDVITLKDIEIEPPPDHLPQNIRNAVLEANRCLSSACWNASAAMYRLALDLATKSLLPANGEPKPHVRRSLGLRLAWLFQNKMLSTELESLANCLKEDGNDGAHDGTLGSVDAEDIKDFTYLLLDRLYSEPARLAIAKERRLTRRNEQ
jgi:hypothetical protein